VGIGCTDDFRAGPIDASAQLVLGYGNLHSASVDEAVVQLGRGLASRGILP
jgi:hypothetical protein